MHCSQKNGSTITAEKKKEKRKKNWGNAYAALISAIQTSTILGSFPKKKKKKKFILGVQIMDLKWF